MSLPPWYLPARFPGGDGMTDPRLGPDTSGGFRNPDASGEVAGLVAFLDGCRARSGIVANKIEDIAAMQLSPGMAALDVGCGTGEDVVAMAAFVGPSGRAVGVDLSEQILDVARRRAPSGVGQVEFHVSGAEQLPFAEKTFDAVHCERLLQHVGDPFAVLQEFCRVTKVGGRLVVREGDIGSFITSTRHEEIWRRIQAYRVDVLNRNGRIGRQMPALFRRAGFGEVTTVLRAYPADPELVREQTMPVWRREHASALVAGVVTAADVEAFESDMERQLDEGSWFQTIVTFQVVGMR